MVLKYIQERKTEILKLTSCIFIFLWKALSFYRYINSHQTMEDNSTVFCQGRNNDVSCFQCLDIPFSLSGASVSLNLS